MEALPTAAAMAERTSAETGVVGDQNAFVLPNALVTVAGSAVDALDLMAQESACL